MWTVDWDKIEEFLESYVPASHLLYVNIIWGETGKFFLIPMHVQQAVLRALTIENYVKVPPRGTNPRGVELSKTAMQYLQTHTETQSMPIKMGARQIVVRRAGPCMIVGYDYGTPYKTQQDFLLRHCGREGMIHGPSIASGCIRGCGTAPGSRGSTLKTPLSRWTSSTAPTPGHAPPPGQLRPPDDHLAAI